jgi:hypothetical protein
MAIPLKLLVKGRVVELTFPAAQRTAINHRR